MLSCNKVVRQISGRARQGTIYSQRSNRNVKMNILQLMPQSPLPASDGGKVSIWNTTKQFALAGHNVHALYYSQLPKPTVDIPNITFDPIPIAIRNSPWRIAKSLFHDQSLFVHKYNTKCIREKIARVIENGSIDVIHADHTCMGPLAQWASATYGIPWGLRLHNVEWMIWQRYAERFPRWHPVRWYVQSQAAKLRWDEADIIRMAPVAFSITAVDRERALDLAPSTHLVVAPGGVNMPQLGNEKSVVTTDVVMASSWTWVHNVEGLRWFLDNVWPRVRQTLPQATFGILGKGIPKWLEEYKDKGVVAEGYVVDLYERLHRSSVYVAPLFVGSGVRIKVLEALAAGLPVVATTVSAEGIDVFDEDGLFRCDDVESSVNQLITLLTNKELRERCFVHAREVMERSYTWKASIALMISEYKKLLTNP